MATVTINILTKQSGDGLDRTKDGIEKIEKASKAAGSASQSWLGGMLQFAAGGLLANGITAITSSVKDFVGGAMSAAADANRIMAQTEAVVRSTGGAAGYTAQQIQEMAGSMSVAAGKSLFDDDDIQRGQNLLLTFTNIKETLPDATQAMVNIATTMGTDVKGSAIQLGKALNDPIKGVGALSRVGVSFTQQQKDQIKALVNAGKIADAQRIILKELSVEFGGSAQAAANASGGMAQLTAQMGDLQKELGQALLPIMRIFVTFLKDSVMPAVQTLAQVIRDLADPTADMSDSLDALEESLGLAGANATMMNAALTPLLTGVQKFVVAIREGKSATDAFALAWGDLSTGLLMTNEALGRLLVSMATQLAGWAATAIPPMIASLMSYLSGLWPIIAAQATELGKSLSRWATAFVAWIVPAGIKFLKEWPVIFDRFLDLIGDQAGPILAQLYTWTVQFVTFITPYIPKIIAALAAVVVAINIWIAETAVTLGIKLAVWAYRIGVWWINDGQRQMMASLATLGSQLMQWIAETAPQVAAAISAWSKQLWQWVMNTAWPATLVALRTFLIALTTWAVQQGPVISSAFGQFATNMIRAITDTLARTTALKDAILKAVQDAWRAALGWLTGASSGGGGGGGTGGGRSRSGLLATAGATLPTENLGVGREMSMSVPGSAGGMTTVNHYNYSPTYSSAPSSPVADFRMMESIARMI